MKYVAYDYEEHYQSDDWNPAVRRDYWHIYTLDNDTVGLGGGTLITIRAPRTEEMGAAIHRVCEAIDSAVGLAMMLCADPKSSPSPAGHDESPTPDATPDLAKDAVRPVETD